MISIKPLAWKIRILQEKKKFRSFFTCKEYVSNELGRRRKDVKELTGVCRTSENFCFRPEQGFVLALLIFGSCAQTCYFSQGTLHISNSKKKNFSVPLRVQCHSYPTNLPALKWISFSTLLVLQTAKLIYFSNCHP